jgi:restriction modification system DNA specificity domain protein
MRVEKPKWENALIKDSIKTLKVKAAVQKKDYLLTGKYPIISQEKEFISGYCYTEDNLNKDLGDVVIFGDHTRTVKYVDFDFCVGADGVKVLRPNNNLSAKYLYYFIKWSNIPSNGYARHFKFLKEVKIKYPKDKPIQQAIASELDAVQAMIDGYKAQIADLDVLAQSIFLDMFGDPVSNPKGWEITVLNDLCTKITDGTHLSPKWVDSGIPFIFVANIKNFEINFDVQKYIDEDTYEVLWKSTPIELGDIVYSSVGSYGNPAIVSSPQKFMFQRHIALLKPLHDKINNVYLKWFLISEGGKKQADDSAIGVAQKTLNLKAIKNFHIPVPPIELQQPFASKVEAIEKQKELIRQQLADAETLMKERMQYYFS